MSWIANYSSIIRLSDCKNLSTLLLLMCIIAQLSMNCRLASCCLWIEVILCILNGFLHCLGALTVSVSVKQLVSKCSFDHVGIFSRSFNFFLGCFELLSQFWYSVLFSEFKGYPTKGMEAKKTLWWYRRFGDSCSNSTDGHWPIWTFHTVQYSEKAHDSEGVQEASKQWQVCTLSKTNIYLHMLWFLWIV